MLIFESIPHRSLVGAQAGAQSGPELAICAAHVQGGQVGFAKCPSGAGEAQTGWEVVRDELAMLSSANTRTWPGGCILLDAPQETIGLLDHKDGSLVHGKLVHIHDQEPDCPQP